MKAGFAHRRAGSSILLMAAVSGAAATGVVVAARPMLGSAVCAGALGLTAAIAAGSRMARVFLASLGVLLIGYAFFGRGFAYLGMPPLFVGELVLLVGLAAVVLTRGTLRRASRVPMTWFILAYAGWGALQTFPYLGPYGIDALRDAVLWGYGAFAILVVALLGREVDVQLVPRWYERWFPWFLLWAPVAWVLHRLFEHSLPQIPGTSVPVLEFSPGDVAVQLAGAASFMLLGLRGTNNARGHLARRLPDRILWLIRLVLLILVAAWNRGGTLAIVMAVMVSLAARPAAVSKLALLGVVTVTLGLAASVFGLSIDTGDYRGRISPAAITENIKSIFGSNRQSVDAGTSEWRLLWWGDIVSYTVRGDYFWTGKGYGINLADDDGYQTNSEDDAALRSPHNGHLTVLARAGVPGFVLWLMLQGYFFLSLMRACLRARRAGAEWWFRMNVWILAYWLACMVNASFDVFLEGPHGGIWFWALFGFGIWMTEVQKRLPEVRAPLEVRNRTGAYRHHHPGQFACR